MSFQIKKETETKENLCIMKVLEDIPGGVLLMASSLKSGTEEIGAGTIIGEDSGNAGQYHIVKTAKLQANATNSATDYRVLKGHQFKVADIISTKDVASCKAYAITSITETETAYDTLTVGTTLGVTMTAANGIVLVQVAAVDSSGGVSVPKYTPKAVTRDTVEVDESLNNIWVGAIVRGTFNESLLPFYVNTDLKDRLGARFLFL